MAWSRALLAGAIAGAAVAGMAVGGRACAKEPLDWRAIDVEATPVQIRGDVNIGKPIVFDAMRFLGGVELVSDDWAFGGLSALRIADDGETLIALSDRGRWVRAALTVDEAGAPIGLEDVAIAPITDMNGDKTSVFDVDAESLALVGEEACVGFERKDRIACYQTASGGAFRFSRDVADLAREDLKENKGVEALVAEADGRFIAISQTKRASASLAWRILENGRRTPFFYRHRSGFDVTDAAWLDDDRLLVLERSFSPILGLRIRFVALDVEAVERGAVVEGEPLLTLGPLYALDNLEALDVRRDAASGRTLVYVASDDNFSSRQRTLLLAFEITGDAATR
ncbi:MAG: esterase-like activity of phytase family protein [Pseudomonadota bacterium]